MSGKPASAQCVLGGILKEPESYTAVRRFKSYPAYKDSGIEWLGEIPVRWQVKRLKFTLAAPLKYGANEAAVLDDPDLPRFVRITDIDESDGLHDETFRSLPAEVAREYLLQEGDILLARSGATVGKTFLYRQSWGQCAYAGYLIRARLDTKKVSPGFVRYFTASSAYWQWLSSAFIQATIQNVSAERYASLRVPLPPLTEQCSIATFLDQETAKIHTLVAQKEKLVALLQEKRTTLITRAVTKGIDPNASMKDSGIEWLGEIPAHWDVASLDKLVDPLRRITYGIVQPGEPDPDGIFMIRGQNYSFGWSQPEEIFRVSPQIEAPYRRARVKPGDIVMTIVGAGTGNVAIVPDWLEGANLTQTTARIALHGQKATNRYFAYQLQSAVGIANVELTVKGAAQPGLNLGHIAKYQVVVPALGEQQKIAEFLDRETSSFDGLIRRIRGAIERLKELRTALISAAVTGKIDLRGEVA